MKVIGVVGTLGAGKTTVITQTLRTLVERGIFRSEQLAYVVNDEGTIEGEVVSQYATIIPMVNGCFTCEDPGELIKALQRLKDQGQAQLVFLEGFGIVSGTETKKFLTQSGLDFEIIGLLDIEHFDRNLVGYQDVLRSHLQSATIGIGLTHTNATDLGDQALEKTLSFICKLVHGTEIFLASKTSGLPTHLLQIVSDKVEQHVCGQGCHHQGHAHVHNVRLSGVHGFYTFSYLLKGEVILADIKNAIQSDHSIVRAKGAVNGTQFGMVHSIWTQGLEDSRSFLILYSTSHMPSENVLVLCASQLAREEVIDRESYEMLRDAEHNEEQTLALIQELLENFPKIPLIVKKQNQTRLVTHPEIVQTIVQLARRKGVAEQHFAVVMEMCVEYWLLMVSELNSRITDILPDDVAKHMREVGVSLAWWTHRFGQSFKAELVAQVITAQPGLMVAKGIAKLKNLNTDPVRGEWERGDYVRAIEFGITTHPSSKVFLLECFSLAVELAHKLPIYEKYCADLKRLKSL